MDPLKQWRQQLPAVSCMLTPRLTREKIRSFQDRRLRQLVRHAYRNVPYYRRLFDAEGIDPRSIRTVDDLPAIPITKKDDLRSIPAEDTLSAGLRPEELFTDRTSGVSGVPFAIRRTRLERRMAFPFWLRALRSFGLRMRDRRAWVYYCPQHATLVESASRRLLARLGVYRTRRMHCCLPVAEIMRALRAYRPDFLMGYAGTIAHVAEAVNALGGEPIRPRVVTVGAEMMTDPMREAIRRAFGAPVRQYYGSNELNLIAWECTATGDMHVCDDGLIVEVLKDGRPAEPGESGEIVATNLHSFAMPFIRYRLGDVVTRGTEQCACGAPFSTIKQVDGRLTDYFQLPDGREVHHLQIMGRLRATDWLRRVQVFQDSVARITLRVVPFRTPSADELQETRRAILEVLGDDVDFRIELVDEIEPGPGGKRQMCVSLVRRDFRSVAREGD